MAKRKEWVEFEVPVTLKGEYEISDGMVTVRCIHGEKSTQLGGSPGPQLAGHLLSEMARDPSSADKPYKPGGART
jgi:hypothetical protein